MNTNYFIIVYLPLGSQFSYIAFSLENRCRWESSSLQLVGGCDTDLFMRTRVSKTIVGCSTAQRQIRRVRWSLATAAIQTRRWLCPSLRQNKTVALQHLPAFQLTIFVACRRFSTSSEDHHRCNLAQCTSSRRLLIHIGFKPLKASNLD